MKNNFWSLIWSSFNEIQGSLITFFGIFVSVLIARFPVKTEIPLDLFIIIILILLLVIATLIKAINKILIEYKSLLDQVKKPLIPKILSARPYQTQGQTGILCLLEKSELFSPRILVSCYYEDNDGLEILIGIGLILHIQDNKTIQAFINQPILEYEDILDKLANNDSRVIYRVAIKPSIRSL